MNRPRRIVLAGGLVVATILTVGWTLGWAQTGRKSSEPMALVPAGTVLFISGDGNALHQAAWEKTAAFEAFNKTGMTDALSKLVRGILEQIPQEKVHAATEIYDFVSDHGLTISVGLPPGDNFAIPYLTIVAHDAGAHAGVLDQFAESLDDVELTRDVISKRNVTRFLIPNSPGVEVAWWSEGPHLVLTVGIGAVDSALAVVDGKSPNLAGTANGKKLAAKPKFDRTGYIWLDFATLRTRFGGIPLPDGKNVGTILNTIGLDSFNQLLVQTGYKDRGLWATVDVDAPSPRKGLLGLADPKTAIMSLDDLPPLPANHIGFGAQSMSLTAAYDRVLELARAVVKLGPPDAADQLEEAHGKLTEILGCDLRDDILATLGSVQCLYSDSSQALLGADYGLLLQVADAGKLKSTIKKLVHRISEQVADEHVAVIERERYGQKLITFRIAGGALNPTILVGEKWLCIGLSSQTAEAFALRLRGDLPVWKPDAETMECLAAVPKKFASISVAYPRQTIRGLISLAPVLLGFGQAGIDQASRTGSFPPIKLATSALDIPPAELVAKPLFPNVTWCVVDETGIHMTTRSSAPTIPLIGGADGTSVGVAAVLVALLLPAVQQAREAARRTQSKNNLKQIGLAMHNFHDTMQHFPQGTIPSKNLKPEERQSWMTQILPFIDQAPLYNQMGIDLRESEKWNDESLTELIRVNIHVYMNPSQTLGHAADEPATTDYAGWAGVGIDAPTEKCKPEKKGIFGYDRKTSIRDITDGTSNTVMVSDVVSKGRGPWAQGGPSTIRALTAKPYVNGPDGIGSPHAGGFQVLMADGSVRFVSNSINEKVLEALATRAGGEVVGDF